MADLARVRFFGGRSLDLPGLDWHRGSSTMVLWVLAILGFGAASVVMAGGWVARRQRLGTSFLPLRFPELRSPLQDQLLHLDVACAAVRAAAFEVSSDDLYRCAAPALRGLRAHVAILPGVTWTDGEWVYEDEVQIRTSGTGPGLRVFERLIAAVDALGEEAVAALDEVGVPPRRIRAALSSPLPPGQWARGLEQTLDEVRAAIRDICARRWDAE
jgi:hypothetical protein